MPSEGAIDSWPRDGEQLGKVADRVVAAIVHAAQLLLLLVGKLGRLAAQLAPRAGDGHALAGSQPDQVRLELGEGGKNVEEHLSHRVGRIIDARSQGQPDAARNESVCDRPGVRDGARQSVELGHDERVARADGGKRLVKARTGPVGAGQTVIGVDAIGGHTQLRQRSLLGGEVLLVGRAAGVADQGHHHGRGVTLMAPSVIFFSCQLCETAFCLVPRGLLGGMCTVR